MLTLWDLPEAIAAHLRAHGIAAQVRYEGAAERVLEGGAVAVSLEESALSPLALGDYLGEADGIAQQAHRCQARVLLELFTGKAGGARAARGLCSAVIDAVFATRVAGVQIREAEISRSVFSEKTELFSTNVSLALSCSVQMQAQAQERSEFTDFEVRSEIIESNEV